MGFVLAPASRFLSCLRSWIQSIMKLIRKHKPNKHFPDQVAFGHTFLITILKLTREDWTRWYVGHMSSGRFYSLIIFIYHPAKSCQLSASDLPDTPWGMEMKIYMWTLFSPNNLSRISQGPGSLNPRILHWAQNKEKLHTYFSWSTSLRPVILQITVVIWNCPSFLQWPEDPSMELTPVTTNILHSDGLPGPVSPPLTGSAPNSWVCLWNKYSEA